MPRCPFVLPLLLLAGLASAAEFGDKRDKPGEVQRLLVPPELIPPATARTPEEEMKTFQLAPGFRIELVASDPLIEDPVAMTIGPDGRMWVVEMRGFMADLDGRGEAAPVGRVVVLEDTHGDGHMDKRTVFLDNLVLPRAIMLIGDGVLVGAPPHLWYCRDTKGDGHATEKIEIANNFGMQSDPMRPEVANPEQAPNSPQWALDNWIYSAHFTRRFRYDGGKWTSDVTTFRGQWGLNADDYGHFFYNSNQDPLRVDILPSQYLGRNPDWTHRDGVNVQVYTNQFVWPIRVNPGVNRGYRPEVLREGRLKEYTAACSPFIYRGGLFPAEFEGNAFVCDPAGNLIKRNLLTAANGTLTSKEAYHEREFLASRDERFRPVNLYTGPDGALYVVDLYRGVLQHRESITTYLRKYSEEHGLDKPINLGRIYRIVPEGKTASRKPRLNKETPAQWVDHLSDANSWWRETAQRLLVERNDESVVSLLKQLAVKGESPMARVHALWTLDGMGRLDSSTAIAALGDHDARVRVAAVRVCEGFLKKSERPAALQALLAMAAETDPFAQQQLVLTLGEAADKEADAILAALVRRLPGTAFLHSAALSGLAGRELALLQRLLADEAWRNGDGNAEKFLGELAQCTFASRNAGQIERLLHLIAEQPAGPSRAVALLDGILENSRVTTKKPVKLASEPTALASLQKLGDPRIAKMTALLTWPGKPGARIEPPVPPLTAEQQTRYDVGKAIFTGVCAACHQPHGLGLEGVAPPLVDSEWVLGSEQRLVRVVLHGLTGPLQVKGRSYRLDMPAFAVFGDDEIAGILTYIRREWEHTAAPVEPATVQTIRSATSGRHEAWLQEQLLKIP